MKMANVIYKRLEEAEKAGVPAEVFARTDEIFTVDVVISLFENLPQYKAKLSEMYKHAHPDEYLWMANVIRAPRRNMPILSIRHVERPPTLEESLTYADENYRIAMPNVSFPNMGKPKAERMMDQVESLYENSSYKEKVFFLRSLAEQQHVDYAVIDRKQRSRKMYLDGEVCKME